MTLQTTTPAVQQKTGYRYVKYSFFKVDPAWRKLSSQERESPKKQFLSTLNETGDKIKPRSYSLIGTRGDVDFMLSFETDHPEDFLNLVMDLRTTEASKYTALETPIFTCINVEPGKMLDLLGP